MKRFAIANSQGTVLKVFNTYEEASELWKQNPEWKIKTFECVYKGLFSGL